jgi:ABC-2 type transport system permease protein
MSTLTYTRTEVLRTFRNRRFFIFSLLFPLLLFLIVAGSNRHVTVEGVAFPLYYMTAMMAFGTMAAVMAGGARIASERSVGWTRQMRITPLSVGAYFRTKVLTGYLMALVSVVLLSAAGTAYGVHLGAANWLEMLGLVLVGLAPFAVLGILLGHLLTVDSMGPAMGGVNTLFALLGGAFFPLASSGALHDLALVLPSYWLVQAGRAVANGHGWSAEGWVVVAVWTLVLARIAAIVYRRDTSRA